MLKEAKPACERKPNMPFQTSDRTVLRDLARRVAEIAAHPVMAARRRMWVEHNSLRSTYPMMLIFPEGSWRELLPEDRQRGADERARQIERSLLMRIYTYEHFQDDTVIEKAFFAGPKISNTGWGLEPRRTPSTQTHGAWHFDPVIQEPADLKKLRWPEVTFDEAATRRNAEELQDLFGDILDVRRTGVKNIGYHLMQQYTALRGLEEVLVDMYSEPQMLHDAMAFFEEGHRRILKSYVDMNLLDINNDGTYQNSGGNGYTDRLPGPGYSPARVRPSDMWACAEAQEMALVSPEHHAEFILQYEKRLLAPFGLTGYGCCEDLTRKLDDVFTIPNIRRISIAPFASVDLCAPKLKGNYIFSWKPQP